jgi:archaellum component FlaG (FlaF/FlaG flagellin family)
MARKWLAWVGAFLLVVWTMAPATRGTAAGQVGDPLPVLCLSAAELGGAVAPDCVPANPAFTVTKTVSSTGDSPGSTEIRLKGGGTAWYFYTVANTGNVALVINATDDKLGVIIDHERLEEHGTAVVTRPKDFPALPPGDPSVRETNTVTVTATYREQPVAVHAASATVINEAPPVLPGFRITKSVSMTPRP